ncbi:S1C family serine protease [Cohnella caldifontis]|uniref:S1C family serine protease n=1 Tax=Cohnella caldifontis TaxID=3027471 RepID=UPI0023ECD185|nr:trypsin-like peptidase domain-containing protein [Cohnella sp. YIM B05605]
MEARKGKRLASKSHAFPAYRHAGNYFVRIFRKARKGVVFIRAIKENESYEPAAPYSYFFPGEPEPNLTAVGIGTGFIIRRDGLILTSEHVVNRPRQILVKLHNGRIYQGRLVWSDEDQDIALLRIQAPVPLTPLPLGSSGASKVGEIVMSIGNPLGLENSITSGIISRKHDSVTISGIEMNDLIQTDCAINPGSSGGPLINLRGRVIGMNAFMAKNKNGLGFALGIDGIKARIRPFLR